MMVLLENLLPGQIYLIKVSASNEMGDGPFSHTVELAVEADYGSRHAHRPPNHTGQHILLIVIANCHRTIRKSNFV